MKDLYNRLVPFLRDTFLDVKKSGRSFKQYFEPRAGNIEQFKQTPLFKKHLLQYKERNEIVERLFEKMNKDFNDGVAHLYMPIGESGEGHFTEEQKLIFYKLADLITQQTGASTVPPSPKETIATTTKNLEEGGNLKIVQPLKLNPKTGFIEGKVINPNDKGDKVAGALSILIDPNNPDEIIFQNDSPKGNLAFVLENSVNGLGIFIGASTEDVMALAGHVGTTGEVQSTMLETLPSEAPSGAPSMGMPSEPGFPFKQAPQVPTQIPAAQSAESTSAESTKESLLQTQGMGAGAGTFSTGTLGTPGASATQKIQFRQPYKPYKQVGPEMGAPQRIPEYETNINGPQLKGLPGRYTEQGLKKEQQEEREPEKRKAPPQTTAEEASPESRKGKAKGKAALLAGAVLGGGGLTTVIMAAADIV